MRLGYFKVKLQQVFTNLVCVVLCGLYAMSTFANTNDERSWKRESSSNVEDYSSYKRFALVIGNSDYDTKPLINPENDAEDIAESLRFLKFDVIHEENADKETITKSIRKFRKKLNENPNSVGFFFYAGHGIQHQGKNYMLPVNNHIEQASDIETRAYPLKELMNSLYSAKNKLNIVVLDACRNDPFKNAFGRSAADNGLGQILAPTGTLIAYSTSPEKTAEDGRGQRNSPYTRHLLNSLRIPDLKLGDVFKTTRIGVMKDTGGRQVPWENSSIIGDFYFIGQGNSIQVNPVSLSNPVKQQASLTINTSPTGATVFLNGGYLGLSPQTVKGLNTRKAYQLEARQQGYDSVTESVRLQSGKLSSITLVLSAPGTHLTVVTEPDNARVRILNIRPSYQDGINLTPGRYHLEVSAEGYQTQTPWVDISGGNHHEAITLEKTSFSESGLGFKWATIPSGSYLRGSKNYSDKQQLKRVSIASFKLLKYEVTQKQWQAVMGSNPSRFKGCGATCPVERVSWDDIQKFIQKLNQRTGQYYRLPSEAEWEYAAKAGSSTKYSWGNEIGHNNANCKGCGSRWDDKSTAPVDSFAPNKFGLYNMHGNVREWTQDCWNESYEGAPVNGEAWETGDCAKRVLRGGSWYYESYKLRSVKRSRNTASERSYDDGFRLVQGR